MSTTPKKHCSGQTSAISTASAAEGYPFKGLINRLVYGLNPQLNANTAKGASSYGPNTGSNTTGTITSSPATAFYPSSSPLWNPPGLPPPPSPAPPIPNSLNVSWPGQGASTTIFPGAGATIPSVYGLGYPTGVNSAFYYYPYHESILSEQEKGFIKDFKSRHPDFDALTDIVELILKMQPGLRNCYLFIALIYDLAKKIKKEIEEAIETQAEAIIDGQTQSA